MSVWCCQNINTRREQPDKKYLDKFEHLMQGEKKDLAKIIAGEGQIRELLDSPNACKSAYLDDRLLLELERIFC